MSSKEKWLQWCDTNISIFTTNLNTIYIVDYDTDIEHSNTDDMLVYIEDEDIEDMIHTIVDECYDTCVSQIAYPNYKDMWLQTIQNEYGTFIEHLPECLYIEIDTIRDYIICEIELQLSDIIETRSESTKQVNICSYEKRIKKLNDINVSLPPQRTPEWYDMRWNMISASSAWKLFHTISSESSLICDKILPLNPNKYNNVNINSPFHWGHKYEPVSQSMYEYMFDTEIEEYGCIPHEKYSFIGASPDGINTRPNNSRYGRLLEIKNIVNRDITGIPKHEYWIQMQLQMEVCDIDECDFLECRFKEYASCEEFERDGSFSITSNGTYKGIIMMFYIDNNPVYEYPSFQCDKFAYEEWREQTLHHHETQKNTWVKDIYWYLDEYSCVMVRRNRTWFQNALPQFARVWTIIEEERKHTNSKYLVEKESRKRNTVRKNNINSNSAISNLKNMFNNTCCIQVDTSEL